MVVGERLRALRSEHKVSAEELSRILGLSRQQVLRYENNKTDITSETLIKIADFFDVSTDYLLGRSDSPKPIDEGRMRLNFELTKLLYLFPPERVAAFAKSLGIEINLIDDTK